jgi:hypothetical protein
LAPWPRKSSTWQSGGAKLRLAHLDGIARTLTSSYKAARGGSDWYTDCICICIYIYIAHIHIVIITYIVDREREIEREREYIFMYIFIYRYTNRLNPKKTDK